MHVIGRKLLTSVHYGRFYLNFVVNKIYYLLERLHAYHFELINNSRLTSILSRKNYAFKFFFARLNGNWQSSANRQNTAIER